MDIKDGIKGMQKGIQKRMEKEIQKGMEKGIQKGTHRFIEAAFMRKTDRIPVWLMRQAGRYMKEYKEIRTKHSFLKMCKTKELACEVTLLPIESLDVDAAILFSDILIILETLGLKLSFGEGGPVIDNKIHTREDIEGLDSISVHEHLSFVMDAIKLVKHELGGSKPLIGFGGAPFTLMSYVIEGGGSINLKKTKLWMNDNPALAHMLLEKLTKKTIEYLNAQIEAGVDAIQIFDTWAGLLSYDNFKEYSLKYIKEVLGGLKRGGVPIIVFSKGLGLSYYDLLELDINVISVDWTVDMERLGKHAKGKGYKVSIQGNLDPNILYLEKERIEEQVKVLLKKMSNYKGYIFNLGHGLMPDIPYSNVEYLVKKVKELGNVKGD